MSAPVQAIALAGAWALGPAQEASSSSAARATWTVFGNFAFADPYFLAFLPLVALAYWWGRGRRGRARARVPLAGLNLPRSARQRALWLPGAFALLATGLVVVALARPLRANVEHAEVSEGVDIVLVIDRSSSMRFEDLSPGRTRLDVVKDVVAEFAERRTTDRDGAADSVALLTFARYPELLCPFTLDAGALRELLGKVAITKQRQEDGTAIGVALAKAVSVLQTVEARSRVVVLLTDGENNVSDIEPLEAGELAAEEGIKVYTIYSGRYLYVQDPFRGEVPTTQEPDTSDLRKIAELTGGRFYRAKDEEELEDIYAEIEKLERTEREERRWEETFDLYPFYLLPALLFYAAAWVSGATWARRLP